MIGTIRRHQNWLWAIIIVLMAGSLVIFMVPTKSGTIFDLLSGHSVNLGAIGGKPITQTQYAEAQREVILGYFLQNHQWPHDTSAMEMQRQIYQRLFLNAKQRELGIQVSEDTVARVAQNVLRSLGVSSLDDFSDRVLRQAGLGTQDFDRFLRHELATEQLERLAGLSGKLVTPQEASTLYRLENRDIQSSIVFFNASNYLASVAVTPEDISKFYTNQLANYRIPEQVQVQYVRFALTNYTKAAMASLTNLDQIVENDATQMGTNLFHGAKSVDESKQFIRAEIIRERQVTEARKDAFKFAEQLDNLQPRDLSSFEKLAASNHMTVETSAPFEREFGPSPTELVVPPEFTRKAFGLTKDDPFAGPIAPDELHPSDVFVIALKDRTPSRVPPFREIEAKVTSDFKLLQATHLAQQSCVRFHSLATNGLAQGKSFEKIAAEAGVRPEPLPPFNLNTRSLPGPIEDQVNFEMLRQIGFSTPPGNIGRPAGSREGAFVLYVEKRLPIDEAKMKKDFPEYLAKIRAGREADAFNQWFSTQVRNDPEFISTLQQVTEQSKGGSSGGARRPSS